jgi:hypothetical protein
VPRTRIVCCCAQEDGVYAGRSPLLTETPVLPK